MLNFADPDVCSGGFCGTISNGRAPSRAYSREGALLALGPVSHFDSVHGVSRPPGVGIGLWLGFRT